MPRKKVRRARKQRKSEIGKRAEDFAEEVQTLGENFGERMDKRGKEWGNWFHRTFGIVGPLISSIFGVILLVFVAWVIKFVNLPFDNTFLINIGSFLNTNLGLFFLIFLIFSYASYFSLYYKKKYVFTSPIFIAAGITIALWIVANIIGIANFSLGIPDFSTIAFHIENNILLIFGFFLVIGYIILSIKMNMKKIPEEPVKPIVRKETAKKESLPAIRRLYRSGNEKILGGICGGIGEYLSVDPVLIRLLWVISVLLWGLGIVAYIIAWIIIPRNPEHKWK